MKVCVFGSSSNTIKKIYFEQVEKLGRLLAENGHQLVFGAGSEGLMGAAANGITKAGGKTIGVIPHFFKDESMSVVYNCDELIFTDTMRERKMKMENMSDVFIIVPGGIGTFEEFFEVLTLKQLARHNKPMVIFNINGYYDKLQEFMAHALSENFTNEQTNALYVVMDKAEDVVNFINQK